MKHPSAIVLLQHLIQMEQEDPWMELAGVNTTEYQSETLCYALQTLGHKAELFSFDYEVRAKGGKKVVGMSEDVIQVRDGKKKVFISTADGTVGQEAIVEAIRQAHAADGDELCNEHRWAWESCDLYPLAKMQSDLANSSRVHGQAMDAAIKQGLIKLQARLLSAATSPAVGRRQSPRL